MTKEELDKLLKQSWEQPQAVNNLKVITEEIKVVVKDKPARELVFDLIASVLFMGERLRELEVRVGGGTPVEENMREADRRRVAIQKAKLEREYQPTKQEYDPTEREWKF